jgi:peptidoglycan/LPS O-acetylase OafA/YrhL
LQNIESSSHRQPVPAQPPQLAYIDAVRGWAVLLVMTSHVGGRFAELPYPIKKLTNFGVFGVQMFFLASAVTLMMSWHRSSEPTAERTTNFFIRRFLRIAPMYYCGALLYFLVDPPAAGFDLAQLLRSFLFVNAWHPEWIPTTPGWIVVPGGWSIGVEFTFYAIFPILALGLTTLSRAVLFTLAALVLAIFASGFGAAWLAQYPAVAVRNFLYFWFPNQLPIFAFGIVLYHLLKDQRIPRPGTRTSYGLIAALVLACIFLAERPTRVDFFHSFFSMPTLFWSTLAFMVLILLLAKGANTILTHPWMQRLGVLSFSCYVLHFLFVARLPAWTGGLVDTGATGYTAIGMCFLLWVLTVTCTTASAAIAHRFIEQPGIELARRLITKRRKSGALTVQAIPGKN